MTRKEKLEKLSRNVDFTIKALRDAADEYMIFAVRQGAGTDVTTKYDLIMQRISDAEYQFCEVEERLVNKLGIKWDKNNKTRQGHV